MVQSSQIRHRATVATVQSADESKFTLLLVDYGYEVEEEQTNLTKLPAVLDRMPPMAHRCTLDTIEFVDTGIQNKFSYEFSNERFPIRVVFKELLNFDGNDFIQVVGQRFFFLKRTHCIEYSKNKTNLHITSDWFGQRFRSQFGQFKPTNEKLITFLINLFFI